MEVNESPEYEPGKIFVGGLSWETDDDTLKAHYEQFGKVANCKVMKDEHQPPGMKKNRGFGFVEFEDPADVEKAVSVKGQMISGKKVDPKKAQKKSGVRDTDTKVFIGGLGATTTEQMVEDYFNAKYGGVKEVVFKVNPDTQRKRGFGFVVFESAEFVTNVLQTQFHDIDSRKVEVKKAEPRSATRSAMQATPGMPFMHQPPYTGHHEYSGANGGGYGQWGAGGQQYHQPFYQSGYPNHQQYSGGGGGGGGGYGGYDQGAYSRAQPTSGDHRAHDPNSYYQHQQSYGHHQQPGMGGTGGGGGGGGAGGGYGHDTSSSYPQAAPPPARGGYSAGHGGYGHHSGGYSRGGMQSQRYGGGYGQ